MIEDNNMCDIFMHEESLKNEEESLKKIERLAKFLADNGIIIFKSAPGEKGTPSNKLIISIHNALNKKIYYEFEEDITMDKILDKEYNCN